MKHLFTEVALKHQQQRQVTGEVCDFYPFSLPGNACVCQAKLVTSSLQAELPGSKLLFVLQHFILSRLQRASLHRELLLQSGHATPHF